MAIKVVGAGFSRTGTFSLKLALERLLGGPCYHMHEVFVQPNHIPTWQQATRGEAVNWEAFLDPYVATVDWPAAAFWSELSAAFPEAIVLLSVRDAEDWWNSAKDTVLPILRADATSDEDKRWKAMMSELNAARFANDLTDKTACIKAYERNTDMVQRQVDPARLVIWSPGDGWEPICTALNLPVPSEPFPHANAKAQFLARQNG